METQLSDIIALISRDYVELTAACEQDLIVSCRLLQLDKHTLLVKEGQYADKTYFIVDGTARAYYVKDGREITDWFAFKHEFITSIESFFLCTPSSYYVELLEPAHVVELSRTMMSALCDKHHCFDRFCRIVVTQTMLQLRQRVVSIQFESAQQRLNNLLSIRPDIMNRVPLGHIASYLGITLETLSRIRHPKKRI